MKKRSSSAVSSGRARAEPDVRVLLHLLREPCMSREKMQSRCADAALRRVTLDSISWFGVGKGDAAGGRMHGAFGRP
jgi:hypothetical protein